MWRFIKAIFICGPRIIYSYFAWMIKYSRHPEKYPLEKRYARVRGLIAFTAKHLRVEYHFEGLEKINKLNEPFVLVCNHTSDFDPLLFAVLLDKPMTFVAKVEIYKFPFIGRCVRSLGGVFLDRQDLRQQLKTLRAVQKNLVDKHDVSWLIFPEGTRNRDGESGKLLPFHNGSFKIPLESEVPLVYASLYGSFRVFKTVKLKKYPCVGTFFPVMYKDEYSKYNSFELSDIIANKIGTQVLENKKQCEEIIASYKK